MPAITATFMALRASGRLMRTVTMAPERSTTTYCDGSSGMAQNVSRVAGAARGRRCRYRGPSRWAAARAATASLASLLVAQSTLGQGPVARRIGGDRRPTDLDEGAHGGLRILEDLTGQLLGAVHVPAVLHEAGQHAAGHGLPGGEHASGHGDVVGEGRGAELGDQARHRQADPGLGDLEPRVGGGDDMVAEQRRGQGVAEAVPVDGGDDRLPVVALEERLTLRRPTGGRPLVHGALEAGADVATTREGPPLAEEDGDVRGVVGIEAPHRGGQRRRSLSRKALCFSRRSKLT